VLLLLLPATGSNSTIFMNSTLGGDRLPAALSVSLRRGLLLPEER
jgi:hypothetical protein